MSNKILDLSAFMQETLDIKMPDGKEISLAKPTQKMVVAILALREKATDKEHLVETVGAMNEVVLNILNTNVNGVKFKLEDVEGLNMQMKTAIIKAYSEYIAGIQSNPNS